MWTLHKKVHSFLVYLTVLADISDILAGPPESYLEDVHTCTRTEQFKIYIHTRACPRLTEKTALTQRGLRGPVGVGTGFPRIPASRS